MTTFSPTNGRARYLVERDLRYWCTRARPWIRDVSRMLTDDYLPIGIFILVALIFPVITFFASRYFRPRTSAVRGTYSFFLSKYYRHRADNVEIKEKTYECGEEPLGEAHIQFHFQYYIYAIIFVVADILIVFMLLWALVFSDPGFPATTKALMWLFVAILLIGIGYALKKQEVLWI